MNCWVNIYDRVKINLHISVTDTIIIKKWGVIKLEKSAHKLKPYMHNVHIVCCHLNLHLLRALVSRELETLKFLSSGFHQAWRWPNTKSKQNAYRYNLLKYHLYSLFINESSIYILFLNFQIPSSFQLITDSRKLGTINLYACTK